MLIYNGVRFIDLNSILNSKFVNIYHNLLTYKLDDKSLSNKDVQMFLYHSLIDVLFDSINSFKDINKKCFYINKCTIKSLKFCELYNKQDFCLFFKQFILELKNKLNFRIISHYSSLEHFIEKLKINDSTVFECFYKACNKKTTAQNKVTNFFEAKGLNYVNNKFKNNPKLKLYICA